MTTGLQFVIGWWYRKSAIFYLPPSWFGPLTWWLALPFAPQGGSLTKPLSRCTYRIPTQGSVSVGVWQMACRRVVKVGERTVKALICKWYLVRSSFYAYSRSLVSAHSDAIPVGTGASTAKKAS